MSVRQELAQFCSGLTFETLPRDVVDFTKLCLLDHLGCALAAPAAYGEDYPDMSGLALDMGGKPEASIIGLPGRFPAMHATFTNTAMGFSGYDAFHKEASAHVQETTFPAAIALAERQQASGADLIVALVLGSEIMARASMALNPPSQYRRGFHPTSLAAPLGCAMAAGKLLRLTEAQLAEALSMAAAMGAGSSVWGASSHPTKPVNVAFQMGRAAESGVLAALLARIGMTGVEKILEHERGFLASHSDSPRPEALLRDLGKSYEIKQFMIHKFCFGPLMLTAIESLLDLFAQQRITADQIAEIEVRLPEVCMLLVGSSDFPKTRRASLTNTRYAMAAVAYAGNDAAYTMALSSARYRQDPRIVDLFNRTRVLGDAELDKVFPDKEPTILTVVARDGRRFTRRNDGPVKGDPANPLSADEVETKFSRLATPVLGAEKAGRIISQIRQIEKLPDVRILADLWSGAKVTPGQS